MLSLTLDTSNDILGLGLIKDGQVLAQMTTKVKQDHSSRLMPAIVNLLAQVDVEAKDLTEIIVAQGPGSYTGIRIGVTVAKSLAWALDIPVKGVSSLEVLAYQANYFNGKIIPFFDARRGNVFAGIYESDSGKIKEYVTDSNIGFKSVLEKAQEFEEVLFLSPNIDLFIEEIKGIKAVIPNPVAHIPMPYAIYLASLNQTKENTHALVPNYLRLAEAEAVWLENQKEAKKHD